MLNRYIFLYNLFLVGRTCELSELLRKKEFLSFEGWWSDTRESKCSQSVITFLILNKALIFQLGKKRGQVVPLVREFIQEDIHTN